MIESTKAKPGPFDGMEKAKPNEPVFTLIARDPHAPAAILFWVDMVRKDVFGGDFDSEKAKEKLIQCTEAEMLAWEMDRWRKGLGEDKLEGFRATIHGGPVDTKALKQASVVDEIVNHLAEAQYHANEAAEKLAVGEDIVGFGTGEWEELEVIIRRLGEIRGIIEPHRGSRR